MNKPEAQIENIVKFLNLNDYPRKKHEMSVYFKSLTEYMCRWHILYFKYSNGFNYKNSLLVPNMLVFYKNTTLPNDIIYIINQYSLVRPYKINHPSLNWVHTIVNLRNAIRLTSNHLYNTKRDKTKKHRKILKWYRDSLNYR